MDKDFFDRKNIKFQIKFISTCARRYTSNDHEWPYMNTVTGIRQCQWVIKWQKRSFIKYLACFDDDTNTIDILPQMYSQWACQFGLLSKITPRNYVCLTSSILWPSILIQFILRDKPFGVNNMKLVFSMFRETLFTLTHVWILTSSTLISLTRISNLSLVQNKLCHQQII